MQFGCSLSCCCCCFSLLSFFFSLSSYMMILACESLRVCNMGCSSRKKGGEKKRQKNRDSSVAIIVYPTGICLSERGRSKKRRKYCAILSSSSFFSHSLYTQERKIAYYLHVLIVGRLVPNRIRR